MVTKIKAAKLYRRDLPKDVARFLVEYGNFVNKDVTATTILEVWRSTKSVEGSFQKKKDMMKWTSTSIGVTAVNEKKFEVAKEMYLGRWASYTSYERCYSFFKEAGKVVINRGSDSGRSVWEVLHARVKTDIAVSQLQPSNFERTFHMAYDCLRVLRRAHPEVVVDLVLMTMPRLGTPWGACSLLLDGLDPLRSLPEAALKTLLIDMSNSSAMIAVRSGREVEAPAAKKRNVGGGGGGRKGPPAKPIVPEFAGHPWGTAKANPRSQTQYRCCPPQTSYTLKVKLH